MQSVTDLILKIMDYEKLISGKPFHFKLLNNVYFVGKYKKGLALFTVKKTFVANIFEVGKFGIEFQNKDNIFETTFLHIQFMREV